MERWLNKVLNSLHLETNLKKEDHVITKNPKTNKKSAKNHKKDTRDRVDRSNIISYIREINLR